MAPVRFRQDQSSLSVLFTVRGILPDSFVLHWSSVPLSSPTTVDPLSGEENSLLDLGAPNETLLLLFNFSSRGSGGCTMDWGVVLRCPSARVKDADLGHENIRITSLDQDATIKSRTSEESFDSTLTIQPPHSIPPRVISTAFSPINAVVVLEKPPCAATECSATNIQRKFDACWWTSVATGRTLIAGMQVSFPK
ncbi:unnamed protein product [Echinostoma caproni]|uniref:Uncharacterized protein n=1 Tax=Echinostoma caproni TaxID=27848 RepID=A0A3P8CF11_9TREM|nr:unnamed protein product [Echinostoma caproni]